MKLKRNLMLAVSAVLSVAVIAMSSGKTSAQDSRPRYSSAQSGERGWTLPSDTVISVQINGTLSSRTARVGDKFTATVTVPVYVDGRTVIPAGSIVEGRVTQVTPAKRMNRSGTIGIDFDALVFPNGTAISLVGSLTSDDPETRRRIDDESRVSGESNKRPSVFIGGGGAIGAVLGGIAGGGKGAVLGGVVGAGAGVASILLSKGEEAQVPSGTPFGVQIKQPLVVRESFISETGPDRGDRSSDQPVDRPAERPDRPEPVGSQPDIPDRRIPTRTEPDTRNDVDRSTAVAPALPLSSPEMVRRAQGALKEQGYYEGEADGVTSSRTSSALRTYQREHKLQETGDLDPQTATSLGIMGASSVSDRPVERPREISTESGASAESVMANVLSASANRTQDGAISVLISTQANSGGWRWVGEHVVNGDTLEVYAKAVRPTGMVTQVLTRGRIELTVRDGVQYVRRVVIHSASGDQLIALGGRADVGAEASTPSGTAASSASSLHRKAEELLSEYQRLYGVRMTGTGVEVDNASQYREAEIELLFAIDSFVNSAQLYERFATSLRDRESMRSATLAMARQARRTDRVISTTTSRAADSLSARWDSVRQDVLRLMQMYNISSSEIEN
ncbi:MAG: peptidoglycan-binding protein [Acidobacteriota bacterium]